MLSLTEPLAPLVKYEAHPLQAAALTRLEYLDSSNICPMDHISGHIAAGEGEHKFRPCLLNHMLVQNKDGLFPELLPVSLKYA